MTVVICFLIAAGFGGLIVIICAERPAPGRHVRGTAIPGPAQDEPDEPGETDERDWWDQQAPQPPAVEILAGPRAPVPQASAVTIGTLARLRDALMPDAWKPDEPGDVTFTPADPDATCTDLKPVTRETAGRYLP